MKEKAFENPPEPSEKILEKEIEAKEEEFEKALSPEGGPRIKIEIFYSAHETQEDLRGLKDFFQSADIYVPEFFGWDEKIRSMSGDEIYQKVSRGTMTFDEAGSLSNYLTPAILNDLRMIAGSKKHIVFADIGKQNPLFERFISFLESEDGSTEFLLGNFDQALQKKKKIIQEFAELQEEREVSIITRLKEEIKKIIKEDSDLSGKEEIKVLLRMGAYHTDIFHILRKEIGHDAITRRFSTLPSVYSYGNEGMKRYLIRKTVDDEFLARACVEEMIFPRMRQITQDSEKTIQGVRKIVSRLSLAQIKKISESRPHFPAGVLSEIERLGIHIPQSEAELDAMLGKK